MRRILFQVHMWTGILAGLYIVSVFVTGRALVYRIELQRALYPHLFTPRVAGRLADPATIMDRVSAAYPQHLLSGVDAPTTTRPTYLAYVTRGEESVTVLIDPVSVEVLGELPPQIAHQHPSGRAFQPALRQDWADRQRHRRRVRLVAMHDRRGDLVAGHK